jgi:adenylosuccinate synthase
MKADVLLGLQWGDEGKGKAVDVLAPTYPWIARFQGGPNAGHTLWLQGQKVVLHTIPSGVFREDCQNLIGNGVVLHPTSLLQEILALQDQGVHLKGRLHVSAKAHLITPGHRILDQALEQAKGDSKIGSTLRGIGPAYTDKYARHGIRYGDMAGPHAEQYLQTSLNHHLLQLEVLKYPVPEDFNQQIQVWKDALQQLLERFPPVDGTELLQQALKQNQKVLAEGAQGSMLDVEFGSYPYVTSSHTTAAAACTGLGLAPNQIGEVYGLFKAYCTRVGSGPFPTELHDATGDALRAAGNEFGATTGRPRRCGWLDLPALNYAIRLSGVTKLILTKADVLSGFPTVRVATGYQDRVIPGQALPDRFSECVPDYKDLPGWTLETEKTYRNRKELPQNLRFFLDFLEVSLNCPLHWLSLGPDREQTLNLQD